ncbi:MAG: hypothetical protein GWP09_03025, partial [Nitrospiraceae bacterium]|nr:hypothetical protein [Nitrospiraceae bacterium]
MNSGIKKIIPLTVFVLLILLLPSVFAKGITFSLDHTNYYFKTGQPAIINLHISNSYSHSIDGMLSYTITQTVNQANFQYSSTNTKSTSFAINKSNSTVLLNFGTSNSPLTLTVDLKYLYDDNGTKEVNLSDIKIHFIPSSNQQQNTNTQNSNNQKGVSSQSHTASISQQQNNLLNQQQKQFQQMQKQVNQMMGNQPQQSQSQNIAQKLENNQRPVDSSALKKQIQNQIQQQNQMKQQFVKQLAKNPQFQKMQQQLTKKGYNMSNMNVNPTTNNTGSFSINYTKPNGQTASIKGYMNNGTMKSINSITSEQKQQMLKQLQQNPQYQHLQKQLQNQGYKQQQQPQLIQTQNKTLIQQNFVNNKNQTKTLQAQIQNNSIKKVSIVNLSNNKNNSTNQTNKKKQTKIILSFVLILIALTIFLAYLIYTKKHRKEKILPKSESSAKPEKPFDYRSEALSLISKSKELFKQKEYKEAYALAAQGLRLYLRYKNNLKKELTNDEIIEYLKKHKLNYKDAKRCFDLCSLVEFAKYEAN